MSVTGGCDAGAGAGGGEAGAGSAGRLASARMSESWRSLVSSRRLSDQRVVRSAIHIGRLPSRKATTISTGTVVSRAWPGQVGHVTGGQYAIARGSEERRVGKRRVRRGGP